MEEILKKIEEQIRAEFLNEASGHDFYHLKRVMNLAKTIAKKEGGDLEIVSISALVHDLHRLMQSDGKYVSPKESLPKVGEILQASGLAEEKIKKVLHCVEFHEEYPFSVHGQTVHDLETLVLQDADRLDAIGAVGIARAFSFGAVHHVPIWNPDLPLPGADAKYDETKESDPSEVHHFYSKLLHLKDSMNTKTGRKMAEKRHKFMEFYLKEFFKEWEGKI